MKKTLPAMCLALALSAGIGTPLKAQTAAPGTVAVKPGAAAALAPTAGPTYDNQWEAYGGLSFMNGQAGQNLPKRYNMGGGELQATYWLVVICANTWALPRTAGSRRELRPWRRTSTT